MTTVVKRNGDFVNFDKTKIKKAIVSAMKKGSGINMPDIARIIASEAERNFATKTNVTIKEIEDFVYGRLIHYGQHLTAKAYESYRAVHEFKRGANTSDESILSLITGTDADLLDENSNKVSTIVSTQRDLIAGEVNKDIARRKMLPTHLVQAHDAGIIHIHDMDYYIQPLTNCCLVNLKDMFENGTVINGKMVETPKSFQTACTIATQIVAQVASQQFGGQTISLAHLAPYVRKSKEKLHMQVFEEFLDIGLDHSKDKIETIVNRRLKREVEAGIQTINYQLNTLQTSNGQSPFVTIFMMIDEDKEYEKETAMLIEEVLKQRIKGMKNADGMYVSQAFPKLVYALDDNNMTDGEYNHITELAVECTSKRLVPDYLSAKKMREYYEGNVFGPMGCRAFLSPWKDSEDNYKFYGRFNMGLTTINLAHVGLSANKDFDLFWELLDARLELAKESLLLRYSKLKGVKSDVAPILWQHGAIARLKPQETIDKLLVGGYATITLGYMGINECVQALTGQPITHQQELALSILKHLKQKTEEWTKEYDLGFALYGTPAESLTYKFAKANRAHFGLIKDITDHDYITNSYHVNVREEIDAFSKLQFEAPFQAVSTGGSISYVETPGMYNNLKALYSVVEFIANNMSYAEINGKHDHCSCGFEGEIKVNENLEWQCPICGTTDRNEMTVVRRTCGYIGTSYWNKGRTEEISQRVSHL